MKIIMPLFDFSRTDTESFEFCCAGLFLNQFEESYIPELAGLSKMDVQYIKQQQWALVYEVEDENISGDYKEYINLLLLAFRIFSDSRPPFIKWRLCSEDNSRSSRISMVMSYIPQKRSNSFDKDQLGVINEGFKHLQELYRISSRTKNAIYFLSRAYSFEKWSESFVMLMIVLESLFSNDTKGAAKKPICQRVSSLLGGRERCTKQDIEKLYDLRCDIVHGRIEFDNEERNNLEELEHLELVVRKCFQELILNEKYQQFSSTEKRDQYMKALDNNRSQE